MADRLEGDIASDEAYESFALETALEHRIEASSSSGWLR
jgi:hypothetical protein